MIILYCLIGIFIIGELFEGALTDDSNSNPKSNTPSYKVVNMDACYMVQQFVRDKLKAPSTAKFENCYDATIYYLGNQTYKVYSYVDSENSFGAMLRLNYIAEIRDKQNEYWSLVDLSI